MTCQAEIRIYVACLATYNNGILHGRWIDACQDDDDIRGEIAAMLAASPIAGAEEYAIHDHEGFEGASVSEYAGIDEVTELLAYFGDLDDARTAMEDHYAGVYRSVADVAEELTGETTEIPDNLRFYIDCERMARDLVVNDMLVIELSFEEVHVFWSH
ncbi:antirestriction protein ArdA [Algiphilus sp. W345]|uniref:Antirestriction protein ArdA n=2 Tax=Banduia mediterranea TaxID=3075609 RepID=A0ABU2WDZ4_9GAMM|nr:antirestriction protein ArdA [Algiphilus sp. W345]MDT0495824.1 antirestriction protein ArdA [Algiphilus sp. W345]